MNYRSFVPDMISLLERKVHALQNKLQHMEFFMQDFSHGRQLLCSNALIRESFSEIHVFRTPFEGPQFTDHWQISVKKLCKILNQYEMAPVSTGLMSMLENGSYQSYLYISFSGYLYAYNDEAVAQHIKNTVICENQANYGVFFTFYRINITALVPSVFPAGCLTRVIASSKLPESGLTAHPSELL